jgi:hypothetical protein
MHLRWGLADGTLVAPYFLTRKVSNRRLPLTPNMQERTNGL